MTINSSYYSDYSTATSSSVAVGRVISYTQTTTNSDCTVSYEYTYSGDYIVKYDSGIWKLPNNIPKTSNKLIKPIMPAMHNFIRNVSPRCMRQYRCQMRNK